MLIMNEDKEIEQFYEEQLSLFASQGYKDLIAKAKEIREVSADIRRMKHSETFFFAKGQLDILDWLINWENTVKMHPPESSDSE
jgi:hypothetical protein